MYVVTNVAGANLRTEHSDTSSGIRTLNLFDAVEVDTNILVINSGGSVKILEGLV